MKTDFSRFLDAQNSGVYGITFEETMQRLKDGKELKDGLWYIFPTLKEFGDTGNDKRLGLSSLYEAYEYWAVPELRERLKDVMTALVDNKSGRSAEQILGEEGARRLHSCATLFEAIHPDTIFYEVDKDYFNGKWDKETAKAIKKDLFDIHEDAWKKYKSKFPQKAFFDLACDEIKRGPDGKEITDKDRYASFLELVKQGYNVYRLTWNYLALRDWLENKERERYTSEALLQTYEYLREDIKEWLVGNNYDTGLLDSLFPNMELKIFSQEISWLQAAYMLDSLSRFAVSYPALSSFTEKVIQYNSQLIEIS